MMLALLCALLCGVMQVCAQQGGGGGYTIDGTVTPTIINHYYRFANGNSAAGAVYFKRGFNIPAGALVSLNTVWPIDGSINLNGTGILNVNALSPLRLGPNFTGFTGGGTIGAASIFLDSDITIAGQLYFPQSTTIHCNKHTITLANTNSARGSFIMNSGITTQFNGGTIINTQDFTTGYGPRFRGTGGNGQYNFEGMNLVLVGDSTMTCTSIQIEFAKGINSISTTSRGTVKIYNTFMLDTYTTLVVRPGVTLLYNVPDGLGDISGSLYSTLLLDNANLTFITRPFSLSFGSRCIVQGNSTIAALGDNVGFSVSVDTAIDLDIAPGSHLTLSGIDLTV